MLTHRTEMTTPHKHLGAGNLRNSGNARGSMMTVR
jgi:hypothetical protein